MIVEDVVSCEGCGAEITHVLCGTAGHLYSNDPDYYLCIECIRERDEHEEPDHDDIVASRKHERQKTLTVAGS